MNFFANDRLQDILAQQRGVVVSHMIPHKLQIRVVYLNSRLKDWIIFVFDNENLDLASLHQGYTDL